MKLISMVDFVLQKRKAFNSWEILTTDEFNTLILDYANFLNQPLTLGMFVPCDKEGTPIINPELGYDFGESFRIAKEQYQQAKERVLFEYYGKWAADNIIDVYPDIESLTTIGGFTLTKSAIKKLGL